MFSTQDHAEFTAEIKRLHQTGAFTDPSQLRCDMFCGRLEHPSTYRLSVFVPQTPDEAAGGEGGEGGEGGSRRPGSALPDGSEGAESPHPGSEE
ncbi:hypothetical protein ACFV2Q_08530 [Streptomyces sp. NPDC059650]|uniref:hypothetical protein n=1 Tax=unclassified Streptomyces TaxID=2593676 RepID=UPI003674F614